MSWRNYEEDQLAEETAPIEAARDAVVEAARIALMPLLRMIAEDGDTGSDVARLMGLAEAVRALEAAEGE